MNSSLKLIFEQIDNRFSSEITDGGYLTIDAFVDKEETPEDGAYEIKYEGVDLFYKKIENIYNRLDNKESNLNEASYKDFISDDSKSERQKINGNIIEINRKLREVEQMIGHASKLKLETGAGSDIYWKKTASSFLKIKERLVRLSGKIVEISG